VQLGRMQERGIVRYNRGLIIIREPAALGLIGRA
jgi:hypothetical protein